MEQVKAALIGIAKQNRPDRMVWALDLRSAATIAGAGNIAEFTFLIMLTFAFTMAIPPALRASRIDPVHTLRLE